MNIWLGVVWAEASDRNNVNKRDVVEYLPDAKLIESPVSIISSTLVSHPIEYFLKYPV